MKNKFTDLNNHLFAQLERLNDEEMTAEQLEIESKRAKAINEVAKTLVASHKNAIEAMKIAEKAGYNVEESTRKMIE